MIALVRVPEEWPGLERVGSPLAFAEGEAPSC